MPAVDPNELDRFFQQHFPIVRAKCARLLGDTEEAADVAQETFLRFCSSPVVHEPVPARLKWLYLTGTRLAIDRLRHRRLGRRGAGERGGRGAVAARTGPSRWWPPARRSGGWPPRCRPRSWRCS